MRFVLSLLPSINIKEHVRTESESQILEHRMDERELPVPVCQNCGHQQCAEEEQLMVHDAHTTYHTGALQSEAVPVWQ